LCSAKLCGWMVSMDQSVSLLWLKISTFSSLQANASTFFPLHHSQSSYCCMLKPLFMFTILQTYIWVKFSCYWCDVEGRESAIDSAWGLEYAINLLAVSVLLTYNGYCASCCFYFTDSSIHAI
jgi:hypothetical protein